MSLREARELSSTLIADLLPYCSRAEVAGSIRRGKEWINDIEIVAIPLEVPRDPVVDLFGNEVEPGGNDRHAGFTEVVLKYAHTVVKGKPAMGRYVQFITRTGVKVDLFMASPDNWGYIFAIRTGSPEFSKGLAHRWAKKGYEGKDGMLTRYGLPVPLREERDLFNLLQLPWVPPSER